jgi:hypothetical protein
MKSTETGANPEQPEILVCRDCAKTSETDSTVRLRKTLFEEEVVVLCETCYKNRADES